MGMLYQLSYIGPDPLDFVELRRASTMLALRSSAYAERSSAQLTGLEPATSPVTGECSNQIELQLHIPYTKHERDLV